MGEHGESRGEKSDDQDGHYGSDTMLRTQQMRNMHNVPNENKCETEEGNHSNPTHSTGTSEDANTCSAPTSDTISIRTEKKRGSRTAKADGQDYSAATKAGGSGSKGEAVENNGSPLRRATKGAERKQQGEGKGHESCYERSTGGMEKSRGEVDKRIDGRKGIDNENEEDAQRRSIKEAIRRSEERQRRIKAALKEGRRQFEADQRKYKAAIKPMQRENVQEQHIIQSKITSIHSKLRESNIQKQKLQDHLKQLCERL